MMETKKRYVDRDYVTAKRAAHSFGTLEESPFEEVEVVEVEGPDGPVRLSADSVSSYHKVWAEMEAAAAVDGGEEE